MYTPSKVSNQVKLAGAMLAMAALVIAVLAVTLTTSPAMAQEPRTGDNAKQYSKPYPCSEEVEPNANTAELVRDGYYAVFDGFWDYEVGHLSNNFCPPEVKQTTKYDPATEQNVTTTTRSDAHVHISKTVFSIPDSYQVTVVDSRPGTVNGSPSQPADGSPGKVEGPTIDIADFPFLANGNAVSAVKTENGRSVFADNSLYWVRLDEPWTSANETSPLQIGFSTALLEEADWYLKDGPDKDTDPDAPVQFRFAAVHVLQDGTPVEAHVLGAHMFAFDARATDTPVKNPQWSNVKTDLRSEVNMQTGQYRPMQFAFTKPGVYLVQAQVQGHVRKKRMDGAPEDWKPVNSDDTITSPVQWYTFHVGSEADLDVSLKAGAVSATGGARTVPITVTAANSGPNGAENVEVEINLPPGLSAPATLPSGAASSGCGVIAWKIGEMASGASPATLSFNASVAAAATGKLSATAEIRSTTFDPDAADNAASAEVTLGGTQVRPPFFPGVTREIVEHAVAGTHAGDPVAAVSPEGRVLSYSLSGPCSNKFQVHPNGQIVLASGHSLDYKKQWEYPLTLHVSDGVNASGGADTAVDDSIPVLIKVIDTPDDAVHPTVAFSLSDPGGQSGLDLNHPVTGYTIDLHAHLHNLPAGADPTYLWTQNGINWWKENTSYLPVEESRTGPATYVVHVRWQGGGITASYTMTWFGS